MEIPQFTQNILLQCEFQTFVHKKHFNITILNP